MDPIFYLKRAAGYRALDAKDFEGEVKINLITNFTDDVLRKLLIGVSVYHRIYPVLYATPYRQYHFDLKNPASELYGTDPDITFIFFDVNPFKESEFRSSREHFSGVMADVERYCAKAKGTVVMSKFVVSYQGAYGNLFRQSPFFKLVEEYNEALVSLAERFPNLIIFDINRLVHLLGERHVFDSRGLYAFDVPFTHEFMTMLAEEWFALIRARRGGSKKCIVLDLDNTLWGGVVGELGPRGIALGPEYPGNAFMNFQRALLEFYERGILLAIASKNNEEDVREVFRQNPFMILNEGHFAAMRINWDEKADSIKDIAKELNIGTESMVFLDDDPVSRHRVRAALPEVAVPEFSLAPEEYAKTIYALDLFHQTAITEEDAKKGSMYAAERERRKAQEVAQDIDEYIKGLGITMRVRLNAEDGIPRLSQLTLKTNQYNLTTRRYAEHEIKEMMDKGDLVFSGDVTDKFGNYGTVVMAIVRFAGSAHHEAMLDTFLMSCRVMGRGVECAFMDQIVRALGDRGVKELQGEFIPTAKNKPVESLLGDHGFTRKKGARGDAERYSIDIPSYLQKPCSRTGRFITIIT